MRSPTPVPTSPPIAMLARTDPPSAARIGATKERMALSAKAPAHNTLSHLPNHIRSGSPDSGTSGAGGGEGSSGGPVLTDMQPVRSRLSHRK